MVMQSGGEDIVVGSASFQLGINLAQYEKDWDAAEKIARQRVQRVQQQVGGRGTGAQQRGQQVRMRVDTTSLRSDLDAVAKLIRERVAAINRDTQNRIRIPVETVETEARAATSRVRSRRTTARAQAAQQPERRYTVRDVTRQAALPSGAGRTRTQQPAARQQLALPAAGQSSYVQQTANWRRWLPDVQRSEEVAQPQQATGQQDAANALYRTLISQGVPAGQARQIVTNQTGVAPTVTGGGSQSKANRLYRQMVSSGLPQEHAAQQVQDMFGIPPNVDAGGGDRVRRRVSTGPTQPPEEQQSLGPSQAFSTLMSAREGVHRETAQTGEADTGVVTFARTQQEQQRERDAIDREYYRNLSRDNANARREQVRQQQQSQVSRATPQWQAERNARLEGNPYSNVRTGQQIGMTDIEKAAHQSQQQQKQFGAAFASAQREKDAIDKEYYANIQRDAQGDRKRQQSLDASRRKQQQDYERAVNLAARQRRITPGGPQEDVQGPGGPPIQPRYAGVENAPEPQQGRAGGRRLFNTSNDVRLAAGLIGIPFGINILASLGRDIHNAIVSVIQQQTETVQGGRQLAVTAGGPASAQIQAGFAQFQQNPTVLGTQPEYQQTALVFQRVANQYQLTTAQVIALNTASGQLARTWGVDMTAAGQALAEVLSGNVTAAQQFGVQITDEYGRLRSVGVSFNDLVTVVGRARAEQQLYSDVINNVNRQTDAANQATDTTAASLDRTRQAADQARQSLLQLTAKPFEIVVTTVAQVTNDIANPGQKAGQTPSGGSSAPQRQTTASTPQATAGATTQAAAQQQDNGDSGFVSVLKAAGAFLLRRALPRREVAGAEVVAGVAGEVERAHGEAQQATSANQAVAQSHDAVADAQAKQLARMQDLHEQTGVALTDAERVRLANQRLIGSADQPGTISAYQQQASAASQIASAALGPQFPLRAMTDQQATVAAQQQAAALQAQLNAQSTAAEAGSYLPANDPAVQRQRELNDAMHAQAVAQNTESQAQARVDQLTIQNDQRRLAAQSQLNDLQLVQIQLQDELAPLLVREANLRDQITLATRENLDIQQQLLQAQQGALAPSAALSQLNFTEQQATLRATVSAIQQMQGKAPSYDINQQIQTITATEFAKPVAQLSDLEARRQVELGQQAQQADTISKQLSVIPQQRELQGIQGQEIPLQGAERDVQAQSDAITRGLQATELINAPALIEAQTEMTNARLTEINASLGVLQAQANVAALPPVQVYTTIQANAQIDDALLARIRDANTSATLAAILEARDRVTQRVSTNVAGGR